MSGVCWVCAEVYALDDIGTTCRACGRGVVEEAEAEPERRTVLVFKDEGEIDGVVVGPVSLGERPARPFRFVPSAPPAEPRPWLTLPEARRFAAALGIDLEEG